MFHYFCRECDDTVDDLTLNAYFNYDDDEVSQAYFWSLCGDCYVEKFTPDELYPVEN